MTSYLKKLRKILKNEINPLYYNVTQCGHHVFISADMITYMQCYKCYIRSKPALLNNENCNDIMIIQFSILVCHFKRIQKCILKNMMLIYSCYNAKSNTNFIMQIWKHKRIKLNVKHYNCIVFRARSLIFVL